MTTVLAIIVYNRLDNLKRWLKCWEQCEKDAELVVIHTGPDDWSGHCKNVTYIRRENVGFDIGSFQDVCRNRLPGFPDYDLLLWCTDDCIPMQKDFIKPFINKLQQPGVGISCMQIAASKPGNILHVRTTGFMIHREIAERLRFPADPIVTKQDCYLFEHRGGNNTISEQIRAMGLSCEQVASSATSPLFDTGYWKRLNREAEHIKVFGGEVSGNKVTFICTIYNTYPQIISSLLLQTHKNWELILIHDGPSSNGMLTYIPKDPRIKYIETKDRAGNWGHSLRQMALMDYDLGDFVTITNADNYYAPVFIDYMLKGFKKSHTAVACYCSDMVHSYKAWQVIPCRPEKGFIDCGGVMVRSNIAKEVGWRDIVTHSSDWTYFSDIAAKYSWKNFVKVQGCIFTHN